MNYSITSHGCVAIVLACWGLMALQPPRSAAQATEAAKPAVANAPGESHAAEGDEEKKSAVELASLKQKVKALSEAFEAKKKELAPRLREAQNRVQQLTAALQKSSGPDASKALEEELHLARESLALLERELALAEEEITVAEGMAMVAEKRTDQRLATAQKGQEDQDKTLTAQDARVAAE